MMKDLKQLAADDGWLSIILPLLVVIAVSLFTSVTYLKLAGPSAKIPQDGSKVLILATSEWIKALPSTATQAEINQHFANAKKAAEIAKDHGYIVLQENSTVASPDAAQIKPGMFHIPASDGTE